jgi:hypothetical protein
MKLRLKILLCLTLTQALMGCAHRYTPPTTGPTAKLHFINRTDLVVIYRAVDNEACERKVRYGTLAVVKGGTSLVPSKEDAIVDADKTLVFNVQGNSFGTRSVTCNMTLNFFPENGKEYEVEFKTKLQSCLVEINKIAYEVTAEKRTAVEVKKNPNYCISIGD